MEIFCFISLVLHDRKYRLIPILSLGRLYEKMLNPVETYIFSLRASFSRNLMTVYSSIKIKSLREDVRGNKQPLLPTISKTSL